MKKLRFGGALCLWAVGLALLQTLLCPKYVTSFPEGSLTGEYYANAGHNDVIFLGDCEVYENFSPVTLWEEYGISSCIRGSAQQTLWQSYYLLEETFRYDNPKVVVFNVLAMKYDTPESTGSAGRREAYNRMTLDTMRWSSSKWNAILASMTKEEIAWDSMFTYIFPILRYHDRWNRLTREDIVCFFGRDTVSYNGYLMQTGVKPVTADFAEPPPVEKDFGENAWYYLNAITELCGEKGAELVLIKAPSLSPVWWDAWDSRIREYAEEKSLRYLNLLDAQEEIGLDWSRDTYDGGLHLNVSGAEKASRWIGRILANDCEVPDRRDDRQFAALWEEKVTKYYEQKEGLTNEGV